MLNTEKKLGALFAQAIEDIQSIFRAQIDLAITELKASGKRALRASAAGIAAAVLLFVSLFLLIFAFAYGMVALGLPEWLAFLLLAGIFILAAGALLLFAGRNAAKIKAPTRAADAFTKTNNEIAKALGRVNE